MTLVQPRSGQRTDLAVRPLLPQEQEAAEALLVAAYSHDYRLSDGYRDSLGDLDHWRTRHQVWVAVDRTATTPDHPVGVVITPAPLGPPVSVLARPGELDFRLLAVRPDARRAGIGELLTRHVIDLARTRGSRRVVMNSGPAMTAAHRLYLRLGFERLPDREDRWVDGPDGPLRLLAFGLDIHDPTEPLDRKDHD